MTERGGGTVARKLPLFVGFPSEGARQLIAASLAGRDDPHRGRARFPEVTEYLETTPRRAGSFQGLVAAVHHDQRRTLVDASPPSIGTSGTKGAWSEQPVDRGRAGRLGRLMCDSVLRGGE